MRRLLLVDGVVPVVSRQRDAGHERRSSPTDSVSPADHGDESVPVHDAVRAAARLSSVAATVSAFFAGWSWSTIGKKVVLQLAAEIGDLVGALEVTLADQLVAIGAGVVLEVRLQALDPRRVAVDDRSPSPTIVDGDR
jgi:hypothetical protein